MTGKSMQYWRYAWNNAKNESYYDQDSGKVLNLLSQYAAFYKKIPVIGLPIAWGGAIGRFFSGRCNTHHGSKVQSAIEDFFDMAGHYAHTETFHSVEFILAKVKDKMGNEPMKPNGDLARILKVINEKTGIDYQSLDAQSIIHDYEQSECSDYLM